MNSTTRVSATAQVNRKELECVQGQMAFVRRTSDEKAPAIVVPNYEDIPMVNHHVTVRNARPIVDELSLDREGFALVQHEVSCAEERDPKIMREKYLEEMVPFIKNYFNASWVVPRRQGVVVRSVGASVVPPQADKADIGLVRNFGAGFVHIDYTSIAGPMLAAAEDQAQGLTVRPYSRLMIIQAWRALSPAPQDFPLAVCDSASVLDTDLVVIHYDKHGSIPHTSWFLNYNPRQRWYYFPEMRADELLLFKGYDSEENCNAKTAHAAFDNRRAYPNAKRRESIEARFFVYYD